MDYFNNTSKTKKAIIFTGSLFALYVIPGSVGLIITGLMVFVVYTFFAAPPTQVGNHDVNHIDFDIDCKPEQFVFNQDITSTSGKNGIWTDYDEYIHKL